MNGGLAWRAAAWFGALPLLLVACVTLRAPIERDDTYPAEWPDPSDLGPECQAVTGTYVNAGTLHTSDGRTQPVLLAGLLDLKTTARIVSLAVETVKRETSGDTHAKLIVWSGGDAPERH
jgi:hypothetical protein